MATVHLALATGQNDFNRLVVVKAVRENNASLEEMRRMFRAEARLSAQLNHPNVVQVFEVVESDEDVMLVMEYLDGLSLAEAYQTIPDKFTLSMRLRVLTEVLRGLHYAHELTEYDGSPLGVVHRDVSPQNVYLTYDGRVKLLDFGIAKATAAGGDETQQGVVKGRVAYMPVEQFSGDGTDRRADVYAVGCMIWEAAAGVRMWGKRTDVEILQGVWSGEVPKLTDHVKDVDPEFLRIVEKATAHQADHRYPSADALRIELEGYLETLPPATPRDVGELLSSACADKRSERKKLIANAIAESKNESGSGSLQSVVRQVVPQEKPSPPPEPAQSQRPWLLAALVGALLVGAVAFAATREQGPASAAIQQAPQALTHKLAVNVNPKHARVLIDDITLSGDPPTMQIAHGSEHVLRIELDGFRTDKRNITVDSDTTLDIELQKLAAAPPLAATSAEPDTAESTQASKPAKPRAFVPRRAKPKPPATAAASSPKTTTANCTPPYYFKDGIKTFKPECI
jgi:serine/threonine-protein kinase